MFFGREEERKLLENTYRSPKSELGVLYGRRRIGKTSLIEKFIEDKDHVLRFEGIENEQSNFQIKQCAQKLVAVTRDRFTESRSLSTWDKIFSYLTEKIITNKTRSKKYILFFDEIQWMAARRTRLISMIKYYWDNQWKKQNVMLIICGSIASFMVKKVIRSNALYGRIATEILLKGLKPSDAAKLFRGKRSKEEILKYLLIFGGVPKYLEEIDLTQSFHQNMNRLMFSKNSFMLKELKKIFYSQFKEAENYLRMVTLLKDSLRSPNEIASRLRKKNPGGSMKESLRNLENAEIISTFHSFDSKWKKKYTKYRISDEFLAFYFKFIEPNRQIIEEGERKNLFEFLTDKTLPIWLGFAFERFCLKHAVYLASRMGFGDRVISYGPCFSKQSENFQIDLVYIRQDNVITVGEVKYHSQEIETPIVQEMERKLSLVTIPRGYTLEKALISLYGPDKHLKATGYFNHYITLEDILPAH